MAFICGDTWRCDGVNQRLKALNTDADALTARVKGSGFPKRINDLAGSHCSTEWLWIIGR